MMSKKWSSYKEAQLMTENWRRYLTEDEGSLDPAAAAETPEVQELVAVAEQDPEVQAALDAVMDELAAVEGLEEGFGRPLSGQGPSGYPVPGETKRREAGEQHTAGFAGGGIAALGSAAALAAIENTAAYAALLKALGISAGVVGGLPLGLGVLGAAASVLLVRKMQDAKRGPIGGGARRPGQSSYELSQKNK